MFETYVVHSAHTVPSWIPRVSAAVTCAVVLPMLLGAPGWILVLLIPDFLARAADRRKLAPSGWLAARFIAPRLPESAGRRRSEWAPKRFASRLGLGMVLAILAAYLLWPEGPYAFALAVVLFALSSLEAGLGWCVGCRVYHVLGRYHLVEPCPDGICDYVEE